MSEALEQAVRRMGPYGGVTAAGNPNQQGVCIAVISLTTTTSTTDLSGANYFANDDYLSGEWVTIQADGQIAYFWSDDSAGNTVDMTKSDGTTKSQQGIYLAANTDKDEIPPARYFAAKAVSGTVIVRIYRSVRVKGK